MKFQDLTYFKHLAESLNFTETAQTFFVSQPSISMALKRLEKELDTVLIDRQSSHKKMNLTEAGELLLKHAEDILNKVETARSEIQDLKSEAVYFGFLPSIGGYFMPKILPHLGRFTQSLKLIEEESSVKMTDMVARGEVPIAIVGNDQPEFHQESIIQIPLTTETLSLWAAPTHPLASKGRVRADDLQDEVFITLEKGYTHQRVYEQWVKDNYVKEPRTLYTKEVNTALSIASSTDMLAFMIDILVKDSKNLVRIEVEDAPIFYTSLILNKNLDLTYFQREFNEMIIDLVRNRLN